METSYRNIEEEKRKYDAVRHAVANDIQLNMLYKQLEICIEAAMPRIIVKPNGIIESGYDKEVTNFMYKVKLESNDRFSAICRAFDVLPLELEMNN